jgi:hypothetical protein
MNILEFNPGQNTNIAVCFVDNTRLYEHGIRELIKNQADGVLANIYAKGYTVFQWIDEDAMIKHAAHLNYDFALVLSTGTEFINGGMFFDALSELVKKDFVVAGHILDRGDAYYELHSQCYVINLAKYKILNYPRIGKMELGSNHTQYVPLRSGDNIHDNYTPTYIQSNNHDKKKYQHKCHGWNILSAALNNNEVVLVFEASARDNKKHFYPESPKDFYKELSWAYHRLNYCHNTFVHTSNTEKPPLPVKQYKQIVTPASGYWFKDYLAPDATVIMYDYNISSLAYWKTQFPSCTFVQCDLLSENDLLAYIDLTIPDTLINLSNIFNYEGTLFFYSLEYRKYKEASIIDKIHAMLPTATIHVSLHANMFDTVPTWHLT